MRSNNETIACPAAALRTHRKAARLSQRQLAERAEVSVGTVQNIECGRSQRPRSEQVTRLADALGVDFSAGLGVSAPLMSFLYLQVKGKNAR